MTKLDQVYVCPICGNEVKVIEAGGGTLVLWKTNGTSFCLNAYQGRVKL